MRTNPEMEFIQKLTDDTRDYKRVRCRRLGLTLDWFSCVKGRSVYSGNISYESKKNFRSNMEFDTFKNNNKVNRKILLVLISYPVSVLVNTFRNKKSIFLHPGFDYDGTEIVIFATNDSNTKVRKSKKFYIKAKNAVMVDFKLSRKLFVDNLTVEVSCMLQSSYGRRHQSLPEKEPTETL